MSASGTRHGLRQLVPWWHRFTSRASSSPVRPVSVPRRRGAHALELRSATAGPPTAVDFNDVVVNLSKLTRMRVTVQISALVDGQDGLLATFTGTLARVAEGRSGRWHLWFEVREEDGVSFSSLNLDEERVRGAYWARPLSVGRQFNVVHGSMLIALRALQSEP
jgi:hypothetical protein